MRSVLWCIRESGRYSGGVRRDQNLPHSPAFSRAANGVTSSMDLFISLGPACASIEERETI